VIIQRIARRAVPVINEWRAMRTGFVLSIGGGPIRP